MDILQEIMLLKVSKRPQERRVTVYDNVSPLAQLDAQPHGEVSFDALLLGKDRILRVQGVDPRLEGFGTLADRGLWVSTGKLVWFRNRDVLSDVETEGGHPLYWLDNQQGLMARHPVECDREQWVTAMADSRKVVLPSGSYCLVNRFSSKEQRRRVHASYLNSDVAFVADNKLNYVHQGTSRRTVPLDDDTARGLTVWLSSSLVDEWYRHVSGSTQVNATDLRQLPCPSRQQLAMLARLFPLDGIADQDVIGATMEGLFSWTKAS